MIVKYPNKILSTKSDVVSIEEAKDIIQQLHNEAKELKWGEVVGLAAPQIGINKRVFLALDKSYINPEITFFHPKKEVKYEGCYSLEENKFDYKVKRSPIIKMKWQDKGGNWHEKRFDGFTAQVLQHEFDHLEGRVCCS